MTLFVAAAFLVSCRPAPRAYLITDAVMLAVLGGERAAASAVATPARRRGLDARIVSAADEKGITQALERALADTKCRAVLAFTVIPVDARQYALDHSGVLFAAYGARQGGDPPNSLALVAQREEAFGEAGRRVGAMAASGGGKVGILAVSPTGGGQREIESFRKGVAETAPALTVVSREARSALDKAAAVRLLREMRAEGVGYYLLKAYGLTGACLQDLARDGGKAVVEDCGGSGGCGPEVVLSVETDWARTLASVFDAMQEDLRGWRAQEVREVGRVEEHLGKRPQG